MRKSAILAATALAAVVVVSCYAADITGKWKSSFQGQDGSSVDIIYTFKQDGTTLTGSVLPPQGDPIPIASGKVEGDKVSFTVTFSGPNGDVKLINEGTVAGDEIKLTMYREGGDPQQGRAFTLKKM
jgi:hypothetical protein